MELEFSPKVFQFEMGQHKDRQVIKIKFKKDPDLIQSIKKLFGATWSAIKKK